MFRENVSRFLNHYLFGGDKKQMISSRVYIEDRVWAMNLINALFFWQRNHCRQAFYSEVQEGKCKNI